MEAKQTLMFRIYQVLVEYSDEQHPLTQQDVISKLKINYDVDCERKAVGRNINFLRECGVEIYSDRHGSFLVSRQFEPSELRLLIDSVMGSRHISPTQSKELTQKLIEAGGKNFKARVKHVHTVDQWNKMQNGFALYNIDLIDEAIERGQRIKFHYVKYGADCKLHQQHTHIVTPYQMLLHNQRYYLFCYEEYWQGVRFLRVDKMTDLQLFDGQVTPLQTVKGYEHGLDYSELTSCHPYMFNDKPDWVEFVADVKIVDQIVDWFGLDVKITQVDANTVNVRLKTSINAMEYWAMQFGKSVEITKPQSLRERVKESLRLAQEKYN